MPERRKEFLELLSEMLNNHREIIKAVNYFVSSSWLQNFPNYQSFFPPEFSLEQNRRKLNNSFSGLWGQFTRWNYTCNYDNYNKFVENLSKAKTEEEVINAFPLSVYEIKVPINDMFRHWNLDYSK